MHKIISMQHSHFAINALNLWRYEIICIFIVHALINSAFLKYCYEISYTALNKSICTSVSHQFISLSVTAVYFLMCMLVIITDTINQGTNTLTIYGGPADFRAPMGGWMNTMNSSISTYSKRSTSKC